jgi:hypothetical protein
MRKEAKRKRDIERKREEKREVAEEKGWRERRTSYGAES